MSRNLQPAIHPDADQLSVFVEGAATARERARMLAHLAECGECRKAMFLMQPHEEPQLSAITPEKRWAWRGRTWRWLVPVGVPVAALACALIAVLIYIRPHGGTPSVPQQVASVRQPGIERPGSETTVAPTANSDKVTRSESPKNGSGPSAAATDTSPQKKHVASGLNLPTPKTEQATANVAPQTMATAPGASIQTADSALAQSTINSAEVSNLPLNGRNVTELQQLQAADTKGASSQGIVARKEELPALQIQGASGEAQTLAEISGRITDRTGAVIAGVTVTLRDADGKTRQTTTGTDGSFHLTELPAGQYGLTATARGFKTSNESIELKPSEMAMLQPVLDVGAVSEVVEVTGSAPSLQTESASVSGQAVSRKSIMRRRNTPPSDLPLLATVSQGKRVLSLDDAGNLFLSRDEGKKWKKIKPQWAGKAVRIELTSGSVSEAAPKTKDENSGAAGEGAVFLLTTDGGAVWSSKDGAHWHQQ